MKKCQVCKKEVIDDDSRFIWALYQQGPHLEFHWACYQSIVNLAIYALHTLHALYANDDESVAVKK